ncbi:hypothetical protein PG994_000343 [Apiospora phragmitis]|uniref:Uncharacterized protein n=1 Tax=Apiospora phragmitis TaxID=2905665 RepID=A0ABR1X609_9PEZI
MPSSRQGDLKGWDRMENLEVRNTQRVGLANGKACIANDVAQISNQAFENNPNAPPDVGATIPAADCGV